MSQEESRSAALEAARALLINDGPQAVTLKAVAARVGRTHANVLHHFGSAAGLQKALACQLAATICASIADAVLATRAGTDTPRHVVDLTFDAFDREGGGALASWMLATGNEDALDPIVAAIRELAAELHDGSVENLPELTLTLVLMALGDALMGAALSQSLGLERTAARDCAERLLVSAAYPDGLPGAA